MALINPSEAVRFVCSSACFKHQICSAGSFPYLYFGNFHELLAFASTMWMQSPVFLFYWVNTKVGWLLEDLMFLFDLRAGSNRVSFTLRWSHTPLPSSPLLREWWAILVYVTPTTTDRFSMTWVYLQWTLHYVRNKLRSVILPLPSWDFTYFPAQVSAGFVHGSLVHCEEDTSQPL